jgi:hypothetical protein
MELRRKARMVKALALIVLALLVVPVSAWAAKSFAPGVWQGRGRVTGGFSGHGVSVHVTHGTFAFCLYVAPNGHVSQSNSKWVLRRLTLAERISSSGHQVTGTGIAHGGGRLKGHASGVKLIGAESMTITFNVDGHQVTTSDAYGVSAPLPISTASPHRVTGDIALKSRAAQQHAGFNTNERALYAAQPVSHCTL